MKNSGTFIVFFSEGENAFDILISGLSSFPKIPAILAVLLGKNLLIFNFREKFATKRAHRRILEGQRRYQQKYGDLVKMPSPHGKSSTLEIKGIPVSSHLWKVILGKQPLWAVGKSNTISGLAVWWKRSKMIFFRDIWQVVVHFRVIKSASFVSMWSEKLNYSHLKIDVLDIIIFNILNMKHCWWYVVHFCLFYCPNVEHLAAKRRSWKMYVWQINCLSMRHCGRHLSQFYFFKWTSKSTDQELGSWSSNS